MGKYCFVLACYAFFLSSCGSLTGIPGHGGGKRFAVEQELVAAATRGTIKSIDIKKLKGKKVYLFLNTIDDKGTGNVTGGRFSLVSQFRGDYIQTPSVTEKSVYPRYESSSTIHTTSHDNTRGSSDDPNSDTSVNSSSSTSSSSNSTTTTSTLLPSPEKKTSSQQGAGGEVNLGAEYNGIGTYHNSEEIASNDMQYLFGLLQTYFFLQGVHIVPPSEAEVDVYVVVDVFGTARSRVDWFFANNEVLKAKTVLEVMAVDHLTGEIVMPPQSASMIAEYNEQYLLWCGPFFIKKYLKPSTPLLSDFTDLRENGYFEEVTEQTGSIPYPFSHQVRKLSNSDDTW